MESFIHLHVHSSYSLMWGVSSPETLCRAASRAGFSRLALTDTNGVYGLIHFLEAARRFGIRPIVGAQLQTETESAVVLAKTVEGYEILSEWISRRHLEKEVSLVGSFPEGRDATAHLAVLSRDPKLLQALRSRADCRVEVVPGSSDREELKLARTLGLPPVATNAVAFERPEDHPLHRLVRAIALNRTLSTLPCEATVSPQRWLKPADAMATLFPHCPEALANALQLAKRCHTAWDRFPTVFPHYEDRAEDHFALLLDQCRRGIAWRYKVSSDAVEKRLAEELELIRAKGYVDYFLVVADIVRRRPIHCGRGSAAASLVSYLLGITHVDPIRHNLLFGRFLNPYRQDPPDIDVDFPWDERDGLQEELRNHYGEERIAMVSNHVGFKGRAAVREVAKVYGMPAEEIKRVTRRMSFWTHPERIGERVETHPRFKDVPLDPPWPEILQHAARLESLPRHLSVHCGGIILAPDRVPRYVPVQRSAKGVRIIQWEKEQAETAGLVKIDLLGNRSLAVIRDALAAIGAHTGERIPYARFNPLDDPETLRLIEEGRTMGVFYVESPAMRQLQQKTGRGDFEHLVIHSSIIRPAANRYIQDYVRRLHGEPYEPLHPRLKTLLAETYGIMVYQEDVVRVSMALAGFGWAEADGLRKVLSKKSTEQIADYRQRFSEGCARRGIGSEVVETVWNMITSFAGYSFCKPHSASYALVSFKSAYLKAHYPAEFMAAVLSNGGGYYRTSAYISEARRMGLTVLGPDVNASDWNYTGTGSWLRVGLQQLRNVRRELLQALIDERAKYGPFRSVEEFLQRIRPEALEASSLVKSGALDSLAGPLNRPQLLWVVESRRIREPSPGEKISSAQLAVPLRKTLAVPALPEVAPAHKWRQEEEALGFVLSVHPLTLWDRTIRALRCRITPAADLARHAGQKVRVVGWPITRKEVLTREGESMEFVSLEDTSAIYEAVFFPKAFQRFCQELDMDRAYLLYGQVEREFETVSLNVIALTRLALRRERLFAGRTGGNGRVLV